MNISLVDFGGILFFGVLFLVAALNIYGSIYNAFSHSGGNKKNLRLDAKIVDVKQDTVGGKNDKKIRTEVLFDDGFEYVSHKTDREDSFLSYRIQVTEETKKKDSKRCYGSTSEGLRQSGEINRQSLLGHWGRWKCGCSICCSEKAK